MNQKKSLMNLLLVSTAALSGYRRGATNQYHIDQYYRQENPQTTNSTATNQNPSNQNNNTGSYNNNASNYNAGSYDNNASNYNAGSYDNNASNYNAGSYDNAASNYNASSYDNAASNYNAGSYDNAASNYNASSYDNNTSNYSTSSYDNTTSNYNTIPVNNDNTSSYMDSSYNNTAANINNNNASNYTDVSLTSNITPNNSNTNNNTTTSSYMNASYNNTASNLNNNASSSYSTPYNNTNASMNTSNNWSNSTNYNSSSFGINPSATDAAQSDNAFIPELLAALYASNAAINLNSASTGPFSLPPLEYDYNALEPYISEETLRIHHDKLHRQYVTNLNAALARYPEFYDYTLEELILFPDRFPSDVQAKILHNAGGHYNHSLTWKLIGPGTASRPTGEFAEDINTQFGSFENLQRILKEAALSVVGSGYAWLTLNTYGRMIVVTTEEQLTLIALRTIPLLPIDVWEHAHYLDQPQRSEYVNRYLSLVDWDRVGDRYLAAKNALNAMNNLNLNS